MMRNQIYHEKEECSKFIREDYEKEQNIKIKELEEEENRKNRVKELQRKRREKINKEKQEVERKPKHEVKKPTRSYGVRGQPSNAAPKRNLPDYYGKDGHSKPSGVAGRTRAHKRDGAPITFNKPKVRLRRRPIDEEEKEINQRSKQSTKNKKSKISESGAFSQQTPIDADMPDTNIMEEIPGELLNQIYSEDLDQQDVANIQDKEYNRVEPKPMPPQSSVAERLMDDNMDVDIPSPRRAVRRPSPPPPDMHSVIPPMERPNENDDAMIQKAIAESLQDNNPRKFPMSKYKEFGRFLKYN